jgi:parallel beta-helix repeat protein
LTARRTLASAASLFLLSLGVVGVAGPAHAVHVTCGQTILVSTVLDSNIGPCGTTGVIIGASNITLDLNGFTITGGPAGEGGPGILLDGVSGVTVKNGTVTLFDAGVAIEGGSGNTVTSMQVLNNRSNFGDYGDGIVMFQSNSNRILNNQVRNNGPWDGIGVLRGAFNVIDGNQITDNNQSTTNTAGIRLENQNLGPGGNFPSNDNTVTNNLVTNSGTFGIQVFAGGSRNQIKFNQVYNNALDGITVFAGGNNNVIESNRVQSNRANGIRIRGAAGSFPGPTGNQILRNVSFGNAQFDLRDDQPNCDANIWRGNQAATFTPPCTMTP